MRPGQLALFDPPPRTKYKRNYMLRRNIIRFMRTVRKDYLAAKSNGDTKTQAVRAQLYVRLWRALEDA